MQYVLMSRNWNAGQNRNITIGNKPIKYVEKLKYLGTKAENESYIHNEMLSFSSNILSFCLLFFYCFQKFQTLNCMELIFYQFCV
jgi:hypothetical protein